MPKKPELKLIDFAIDKIICGSSDIDIESLLREGRINWGDFRNLVSYHEIAPFIYMALKPYLALVPEDIKEMLYASYWGALKGNMIREREYGDIYDAFKGRNVEIVPIKGVSFNYDLYSGNPVRPMSDIDVLIKEEDYIKAAGILERIGYKKDLEGLKEDYWLHRQCHIVFLKEGKGLRLELHHGLDFKRNNKKILPYVWSRTVEFKTQRGVVRLLSPEDTIFSLALHQRRRGKMFCMKYALDTALILRKYKETLDWDYIRKMCREYRLYSPLYFLLLQVITLLEGGGDIAKEAETLRVPGYKKNIMRRFIIPNMHSFNLGDKVNDNYLKSHFLLYDSFIEPILYILNIPQEQFAKYCGLEPYARKTRILYNVRFLYLLGHSLNFLARNHFK